MNKKPSTKIKTVSSPTKEFRIPTGAVLIGNRAPSKLEIALHHGLMLEQQLQRKEQDLIAVREQHQLIFQVNQGYEEGNTFLRAKVEKLETEAADYKAKLVDAGLEPETPPSAEQQQAAMFAKTRADAQEEALKSTRQDRLLLLERLRQAEKLLRDVREFVPNPGAIDDYLNAE